jgi:sugar lactone lactonase YvrE
MYGPGSNPNVLPGQAARLLGPLTEIAADDFAFASGLAVDSAGNIYVSEGVGQAIYKIPYNGGSYGTPVAVFSGTGVSDVTVDSAGNLYFVTQTGIEKLPYSGGTYGTPVVVAGGLTSVNSVSVDSAGNIYVTDYSVNAVKKIPYSGGSYGTPVPLGSGFNQPTGAVVDAAGNVYVADYGNLMIKEIPYNGGSYGTPVPLFYGSIGLNNLYGIALDSSGNLYVSDSGVIKELQTYAPGSYGFPYVIGGSVFSLEKVAVDSAGNVYSILRKNTGDMSVAKIGPVPSVIDFGASNVGTSAPVTKILNFSIDDGGTIEPPLVVTQGSTSLDFTDTDAGTCTTNGNSYNYSDGEVCTVVVSFTPSSPGVRNGAAIIASTNQYTQLAAAALQGTGNGAQVTYPPGLAPDVTTGYNSPSGLVENESAFGYFNTYSAEYANNQGYIRVTSLTGSGGGTNSYACGTCHPTGLAVDQTGRIIYSDITDNTVKLFAAYDPQYYFAPFTVATGFYQPMGVAVDALGNIYVADTNNSVIKKISYTPANGYTTYDQYLYGTPVVLGSGFSYPEGVAVDGAGNVYVADTYNNAVKKIPYSGGSYGTPVTLASGFNYPANIVLDGGGNIYVADQGSNSIKKIPYSGGSYGTPVTLNSTGLNGPVGLSIEGSGNLLVTEPAAGAIAIIDLSDAPTLYFPNTAAGSTSTTQTLTIANTGNYPLTLVPPAAGYNPSVSANFSLGNASTCPQVSSMSSTAATLAAGASCTDILAFAPTTTGTITGSLTVSDKLSIPSATVTQTVPLSGVATQAPPIITVTPVTIPYGTTSTMLSATVSFNGPLPANSPFFQVDNGNVYSSTCTAAPSLLSCSVMSYATVGLSVGRHTITVGLAKDGTYSAVSNTGTLTVNAVTPTVSVPTVSTTYGATTTVLSASIAYTAPTAPTGAVSFKVDGGATVPATCSGTTSPLSCSASYATGALTTGGHTITVSIAADAIYASASNTGSLTITAVTPTVTIPTVLTTYGTATTALSASIIYLAPTAPTGAVAFKVDSGTPVTAICVGVSSPLSCSATYSTAALSAGSHTITVATAADANYTATSAAGTLTVNPATPSVTVPAVSTTYGTATTTLSATITYAGPSAPTGAVLFKVDSGTSVAGSCSGTTSPLLCSASYSTGALTTAGHTITVSISADANYVTASNTAALTVGKQGTVTTLGANPTSITPLQTTTLTATVSAASTGSPTGTITFYDNGAPLGSPVAITAGQAQLSTLLPSGAQSISATYSGDGNFFTSSAATGATVSVAPLDFSLASTSAVSLSVVPGSSTTISFNVAPLYQAYPGPVSFSVSGLPSGATYTITPTSIPANGGAQTVTVVIKTAPALAKSLAPMRSAPIALAMFVPLLAIGVLRRRRHWLGVLVLVASIFAGTSVVGCGSNNGNGLFGQAPQTYPVVITVTSGTMQHTINVTLQIL